MSDNAPERHGAKGSVQPGRAGLESETTPQREDSDDSEPNFVALGLGLLVVLGLLVGGWFIFSQMRCNPLYSDAALSHSKACQ
jgi:hypothetical protein